MLRIAIIMYFLLIALAMSAQQNNIDYYCYNEQKYLPAAPTSGEKTYNAPEDSTTNQLKYGLTYKKRHLCSLLLPSKCDAANLNADIYSYYRSSSQKVYTFLDEYRSDLARNLFWKQSFGKWQLVMNGAKGFCDIFSTEYMEKQFSFVSPELYRKYTVAYSTGLKWGTFGAGVNLRTLDFRIFLVSCKL